MRMLRLTLFSALVAAGAILAGSPQSSAESLADRFARPEQTVEHHFMIAVPAFAEADLAKVWQTAIVERLAPVAEVGPVKKPKPGIYVDSPDRGLDRQNLIVRVRQGLITFKARAASTDRLLDLAPCSAKKYEMDFFGTPDYSISSDIKFKEEEFDVAPTAWTPPKLWDFVAAKCPALSAQVAPVIAAAPGIEIPGVAKMYSADAKLTHPAAAELAKDGLEAGVSVWFFPPKNKMLVELAFTGSVKHAAAADTIHADILAKLRASGSLAEDQSSKTLQYFAAYLGPKKN